MAGLLTTLFGGGHIGASYAPSDDFWYRPDPRFGGPTLAGVAASPEQAMRLSAVYRCVDLLSNMVAILPLLVYRRTENDGKTRATTHPAYRALRRRPNPWQTAFEWKRLGKWHVLLRGNFLNQITYDRQGAVSLIPLHPDRVQIEQLASGRRGYRYRPPQGPERVFTQDEILHEMGPSFDGVRGVSVLEYARESVGKALAQDGHAARFWASGAGQRVAVSVKQRLTEEQRQAARKSWQQLHGGVDGAFSLALFEGDAKVEPIGISPRDAQFVEGISASVEDIARWFGVPPHMIGHTQASTSWGTGLEQMTRGFLSFTLMPWLVSLQEAVNRDLLDDGEALFAEFLTEALLSADLSARYSGYQIALGTSNNKPFMTVNEVRRRENLDPWPGGDTPPADPAAPPAAPPTDRAAPMPPPAPRETPPRTPRRAAAILRTAAEGAVRREVAAIRRQATPRHLVEREGWATWVRDFYVEHAGFLEAQLHLAPAAAAAYCTAHREALLAEGPAVLETWDTEAPATLAALVEQED